jgi:pimeloyl-ACP methyl ester carboxylesterase
VGTAALVAIALVLAGLGAVVLVGAQDDLRRTTAMAGATPVRILTAEGAGPPGPGTAGTSSPAIVLAHGFSGSAAMMDPLGSALARAGHVVVLPDLPGHAGNPAALAEGRLEAAIDDAVALAADLTGQPVAVVGHSMGAGAVTRWATEHQAGPDGSGPDLPAATVAISLPSAQDLPADPGRPRNLLLLWGSAEQPRFVDAALAALALGYPDAEPGTTYGDPAAGTARRAVEIAGAEHVAVIYRAQTGAEIAAWIGSRGTPAGDARFVGLLLVLAGAVVAAVAIVREPRSRSGQGSAPQASGAATLGLLALAMLAGVLGARLLQPLGERIPVAVAGYLAAWFAWGALVLLAAARRRRAPMGSSVGLLRGVLAGMVLSAGLALPARSTWAAFVLGGPRWWVLFVLLAVLAAWCWGEAALLGWATGWRRAGLLAASRVLIVVGLLGAVALLGAPGFLTLTVPLMIPLLAVLGVVAHAARDPLAAASAQALPLALAIASTFPMVA